jgi:hypothetical protein
MNFTKLNLHKCTGFMAVNKNDLIVITAGYGITRRRYGNTISIISEQSFTGKTKTKASV